MLKKILVIIGIFLLVVFTVISAMAINETNCTGTNEQLYNYNGTMQCVECAGQLKMSGNSLYCYACDENSKLINNECIPFSMKDDYIFGKMNALDIAVVSVVILIVGIISMFIGGKKK